MTTDGEVARSSRSSCLSVVLSSETANRLPERDPERSGEWREPSPVSQLLKVSGSSCKLSTLFIYLINCLINYFFIAFVESTADVISYLQAWKLSA